MAVFVVERANSGPPRGPALRGGGGAIRLLATGESAGAAGQIAAPLGTAGGRRIVIVERCGCSGERARCATSTTGSW